MTLASCQLLPTQASSTNVAPHHLHSLCCLCCLAQSSPSTPCLCQAPRSTPKRIPLLLSPSPLPSGMAEPGQDMVELGPVATLQSACGKVGAGTGLCGAEKAPCRKDEVKQQLCRGGVHRGLARGASGHEGARDGLTQLLWATCSIDHYPQRKECLPYN